MTPSNAVQFLAHVEHPAGPCSVQRMSPFLPSCSWTPAAAQGDMAEEWNPVQSCVGKLPAWLLPLLPDLKLRGSLAGNARLSCGRPVGQGLLFLTRGKEGNSLCNSAPRPRSSPWPLTFGGCPVRPTITQTWGWNWAGGRFLTISAWCYRLVSMSGICLLPIPLFFVFLLTFQFIRFILCIPSMIDWKWERDLKNLHVEKQHYFLSFAGSWIRDIPCDLGVVQEKEWPSAIMGDKKPHALFLAG